MPITRLNHAVLYVRDVERSAAFYRDVLGFRVLIAPSERLRAAFLLAPGSVNDHDLGLFEIGTQAGPSDAGRRTVGLYHLAWEVDTLGELARLRADLLAAGALVGESDHVATKSLYAKDPDGLEFEVAWILPAAQAAEATAGIDTTDPAALRPRPLDVEREIARYGAATAGGRDK